MTTFQILLMVFLHIVDDFFLQSAWLANGKQKSWWKANVPDEMYKDDYIMALVMHGLSWSFMIMLPVAWSQNFDVSLSFFYAFLINATIHSIVDHLKANCHKLNLISDQLIHLTQIMFTAIVFILL